MNSVDITKFFYIICKSILLSLFIRKYLTKGLLGLVLIYFKTTKINNFSIIYLYCLIWLKKVLYLLILYIKFLKNKIFCIKLLLFLKHIIKCFIKDNTVSNN